MNDIFAENIRRCAAARDAKILAKLRELGPGWAVGWAVKRDQALPDPHRTFDEAYVVSMEWELHAVALNADGTLPFGHADFQYVTLKDGQ